MSLFIVYEIPPSVGSLVRVFYKFIIWDQQGISVGKSTCYASLTTFVQSQEHLVEGQTVKGENRLPKVVSGLHTCSSCTTINIKKIKNTTTKINLMYLLMFQRCSLAERCFSSILGFTSTHSPASLGKTKFIQENAPQFPIIKFTKP